MPKSEWRFADEQIIGVLREQVADTNLLRVLADEVLLLDDMIVNP